MLKLKTIMILLYRQLKEISQRACYDFHQPYNTKEMFLNQNYNQGQKSKHNYRI